MRAVVPIVLVIAGLAASEFAYSCLPGGLANADAAEIAFVVQEGAIAGLDRAFPEWRDEMRSRTARAGRHIRHPRRRDFSTQTRIIRNGIHAHSEMITHRRGERKMSGERGRARLRGFGQRDSGFEHDQSIEITFVVPSEKESQSANHRSRGGTRRNQ